MNEITVIGGGFAGVEAAWVAATRGAQVVLYEMRPVRMTAVHRTGDLAELVCSNSFKSNLLTSATGVLKEEMRRLGSVILPIAQKHRVPAGEALAVDREPFAREVTQTLESHPNITIRHEEIQHIPESRPLIIATGPLTTDSLADQLQQLTGSESLYFFDAVAPTVTLDSLDMTKIYRGSRRGKGDPASISPDADDHEDGADNPKSKIQNPKSEDPKSKIQNPKSEDYLNCPLTKEEYLSFWSELTKAEQSTPHNPEDANVPYFEMCLPVEEIARRGPRTLAFGPMKPVGLRDPRTGRGAYAVLQLRQENKDGTLWGLVGFQSRLKWGEQKRIFRMIPGLENAEFVRFGVMHRNTYVCSPRVLDLYTQLRVHPGIFLAGQLTGVEGYLESAAIGMVAGLNAQRLASGLPLVTPPRETALGSLCHYLVETMPKRFAPMNSNFGIMPELPGPTIRDKREKALRKAGMALAAIDRFVAAL